MECNKAKRNKTRYAYTCFPHGGDRNLSGAQMCGPRPLHPGQMLPNSYTTMKSNGRFIPVAGDPAITCSFLQPRHAFYSLILSLCTEDFTLTPTLKPLQEISFPLLLGSWNWKLQWKADLPLPQLLPGAKLIPCWWESQ